MFEGVQLKATTCIIATARNSKIILDSGIRRCDGSRRETHILFKERK